LIYCCEKVSNGVSSNCKKNIVINDSGIAKVVFYKFFICKEEIHLDKKISFIDNFTNTLSNKDTPLAEDDFINIISLLRKTYNSLKRKKQEHKSLDTVTEVCNKHLDLNINYSRGILLDDGSFVIFQDFSLEQTAYLESIIKRGGV
jgi:hypothetical protein